MTYRSKGAVSIKHADSKNNSGFESDREPEEHKKKASCINSSEEAHKSTETSELTHDLACQKLENEREREKQLLAQWLALEARLNKAIKDAQKHEKERVRIEKKYQNIMRSKKYILIKPILILMGIWKRVINFFYAFVYSMKQNKQLVIKNKSLTTRIDKLQKELATAQQELDDAREQISQLTLELKQVDHQTLHENIKNVNDQGKLINYLDDLVSRKIARDKNFSMALSYAGRLYKDGRIDFKQLVYSKVLAGLHVDEIPEFIVRAGLEEGAVDIKSAASFRACLTQQSLKKQLGHTLAEWMLDDKVLAYSFVDTLGIKRPMIMNKRYKLNELPRKEGIVIKPCHEAGARGVYLVLGHNQIFNVRQSHMLSNWDSLLYEMKNDLNTRRVRQDDWIIEELIYEDKNHTIPARDLKFYCFYGKIGLVLEIVRYPQTKYCWWTPDGELIHTGKYEEELFIGKGFSNEEIELVSNISKEIPAPFIRIDFLKTNEGLVFGEFTPKPGNYDQFDQQTDQHLGELFLDAEARLIQDLLNGKTFNHFTRLYKEADMFNEKRE